MSTDIIQMFSVFIISLHVRMSIKIKAILPVFIMVHMFQSGQIQHQYGAWPDPDPGPREHQYHQLIQWSPALQTAHQLLPIPARETLPPRDQTWVRELCKVKLKHKTSFLNWYQPLNILVSQTLEKKDDIQEKLLKK